MNRNIKRESDKMSAPENAISRRVFLNGMAVLGTASLLAPALLPGESHAATLPAGVAGGEPYPPALTGLRGGHPGAFDSAHALAWKGVGNHGPLTGPAETYDLVIIGAGISGLSAAHFYQEKVNKNTNILILDNHDDFGGHATRNEFIIDGKTYITYGGNQSIVSPGRFGKASSGLFKILGVRMEAFESAYQKSFFKNNGLSVGVFYDKETFGRGTLVRGGMPNHKEPTDYSLHFMPGLEPVPSFFEQMKLSPLNNKQIAQIEELKKVSPRAVVYFSGPDGKKRFDSVTYFQFLMDVYGIEDRALLTLLSMLMAYDSALGGTMITIPAALESRMLGLPPVEFFFKRFKYESQKDEEPFIHHFPDGCASVARLLVKELVPDVASFETPEQCVTARFDYSKLDRANQPVRIRLGSTAVHIENTGSGTMVRYLKKGNYLNRGELFEVHAKHTVMAGWHIMAAHMIPSLPEPQKKALCADIKLPLVWAQVLLRNWQPLKKSGVAISYCPGSYFQSIQCDFPVNMGDYQPERNPDSPLSLLMVRMPCPTFVNKPIPDLVKMGLDEMLSTSLDAYEEKIREQLTAMYGQYGFDAGRDIAGITVNRWPHGYLWTDAKYDDQSAYLTARKRHGRIVFANADSAGNAYLDNAIDMAYQAVSEIAKI